MRLPRRSPSSTAIWTSCTRFPMAIARATRRGAAAPPRGVAHAASLGSMESAVQSSATGCCVPHCGCPRSLQPAWIPARRRDGDAAAASVRLLAGTLNGMRDRRALPRNRELIRRNVRRGLSISRSTLAQPSPGNRSRATRIARPSWPSSMARTPAVNVGSTESTVQHSGTGRLPAHG
jgi:hypothetical protein